MSTIEYRFRSHELLAPSDKPGGAPPGAPQSEHPLQSPLERPELTGKQLRRFAEPAVSSEEATALLEAIPWELLTTAHAGRARKQLLEAVQTILPELDGHNAAMKALEHELDYKEDELRILRRKGTQKSQSAVWMSVLQEDIDFLKTLLEEE